MLRVTLNYSIAIGNAAGSDNQRSNTLIMNAHSNALNYTTSSHSCFIKPIPGTDRTSYTHNLFLVLS
jgi:hypothetical protein